jgi:hypothetical protein
MRRADWENLERTSSRSRTGGETMTDPDPAKFAQLARNLKKLSDQLRSDHPDFPVEAFGRAFAVVAVSLLLDSVGDKDTVGFLRDLARDIEAGEATLPPPN